MTDPAIIQTVARSLNLPEPSVAAAVALLEEGNTIPFIARYRKERTGGLDEEQLRAIAEQTAYQQRLRERKAAVLKRIAEQGKLTPALRAAIEAATTMQAVEDLYRPYRPKRRTRATIARRRGLEPLAALILEQTVRGDREAIARPYLSEEVPTVEEAYAGARDIVAEQIAEDAEVRAEARRLVQRHATLGAELTDAGKDPRGVYRLYYDFAAPLRSLRPHQVLALNRGEREGALRLRMDLPGEAIREAILRRYPPHRRCPLAADLLEAVDDGYRRLLAPALVREARRELTRRAEEHAIAVFARNLRHLLLQPPLRGRRVLGIDPGYRTGCKVAVVDPTGRLLATATIYPHPPQARREEAMAVLHHLITTHAVEVIAIGNGTASRETEHLVAEVIAALPPEADVHYAIVDEAGASVYSASPLARQELPDLDVAMRGAVSIARRLQDPLAELVKIDPKSIGVGLYQHDVDQKRLAEALDAVVESVVNRVGVDVNTASPALLRYVAGIGPKLAQAIVAYRDAHGPFPSRAALLKVPGLGPKSFQQAAGFLRVPGGENPLDNTGVHPESYPVVERLLEAMRDTGRKWNQALNWETLPRLLPRFVARFDDLSELADWLEVGLPTLEDIIAELTRPGRDPRDELPPPILRQDVLTMEDLRPGMRLRGTVRNVVDFGAFVDIGIKQDGLIHVSQMGDRYVRNPHDLLAVGDIVDVTVLSVDVERGRIGLRLEGRA